jgi:hypothetical protein
LGTFLSVLRFRTDRGRSVHQRRGKRVSRKGNRRFWPGRGANATIPAAPSRPAPATNCLGRGGDCGCGRAPSDRGRRRRCIGPRQQQRRPLGKWDVRAGRVKQASPDHHTPCVFDHLCPTDDGPPNYFSPAYYSGCSDVPGSIPERCQWRHQNRRQHLFGERGRDWFPAVADVSSYRCPCR